MIFNKVVLYSNELMKVVKAPSPGAPEDYTRLLNIEQRCLCMLVLAREKTSA